MDDPECRVVDGGINGDRLHHQISGASKSAYSPARPHLLRYPERYPGAGQAPAINAGATAKWSRSGQLG
jgi:hypothetical protein